MPHISESTSSDTSKLFFTIHLGSPNDKPRLDEHDRVSVIHKITQKFDTFTLVDGKGLNNGQFEDTLLIHIATNDTHAIAELAHSLCNTFDHDEIGIQHGRHMTRAHRNHNVENTASSLNKLK